MDKIKRFFECLVPVTVCNIECSYCYVIQNNKRSMKIAEMQYSPQHIAKALSKDRLGGTCLISLCGAGETLAQPEVPDIAACILNEGHYVNITTNGTLTERFGKLIEKCSKNIHRLHISFSLHYIELKKRDWLERFFLNVNKMKSSGASILVQINMCDEYMPYIDEIKTLCKEKLGAYPQVALTRDEESTPMKILTKGTVDNYLEQGDKFNSPLFDFTVKNFMKRRNEFCYAGDWSGTLNLQTGILTKCYANSDGINIFENIREPIPFEAIGKNCKNGYCINSSHFMSLGIIPEIKTPSYASLRNRCEANWYSLEMKEFLSGKLYENNKAYSKLRKCKINNRGKFTVRGYLAEFDFYKRLHNIKVKKREK